MQRTAVLDFSRLEVPAECRDAELWRLLHEFEFCRWHADYGGRADELRVLFQQPEMQERLTAALADPRPEQRFYAGRLLVAARSANSAAVALRLLADADDYVRGKLAELPFGFRHEQFQQPLMRLAREDPSPLVRGGAATGLAGQDPLLAIPILLEIIEHDHEVNPEETVPAPSDAAASALDALMGTAFIETRLDGGVCTFPSDPGGAEALKRRAIEYCARLADGQPPRG